ncbi:carbon-nitrogen hydrolase family protein [bacterium SCSIO 12741]|nr:carbon-nitrogen hydrolase family protein [bacterium SCSIO 12741]
MENLLKIGMAQIAPVLLDRNKTLDKVKEYVLKASQEECGLVVFGEAMVPGYPFWLSLTHASEFNSIIQKEIHAHYIRNAVQIESGDLDEICELARTEQIAIYLGIIERAQNRGGHSLYCSLVYIDAEGSIRSVHRKLQPTYEERLSWSPGDGHGLQVHDIGPFRVGGLNCWENWMPLSRTALYGQGENLHIAVWPGCLRNTEDITPFLAKEGRSFSVSVSGVLRKEDIPEDIPHYDKIIADAPDVLVDGGSCIAAPNGEWIVAPVVNEEGLFTANLDFNRVLEERQNFDPVGHYSRPDVTKLIVNRERQAAVNFL